MGPRLFSRGRWSLWKSVPARLTASMGPRLFSRGRHRPDGGLGLLWSRFNGAAAVQPRKAVRPAATRPTPAALQWGRGCSAAEGSSRPGRAAGEVRASMGPRLFSRGRHRQRSARESNKWLQWGRGCSAAEGALASSGNCHAGKLQWGRGCSAAEGLKPGLGMGRHVRLQWGRGCSAAEGATTR